MTSELYWTMFRIGAILIHLSNLFEGLSAKVTPQGPSQMVQ